MVDAVEKKGLAEEIGIRMVSERAARYNREVFGDRFNGDPNFDHAEGGEDALRRLAEHYDLEVPSEDETRLKAVRLLHNTVRMRANTSGGKIDEDGNLLLEHLEGIADWNEVQGL